MMLSDMGAEVLRVDRADAVRPKDGGASYAPSGDVLGRNRRSVGVDLKHPDGRETVLRLVEKADALIEGFRPGVTERLGLGPSDCEARNPKLVYGRMTGWGQAGPYANAAGHDINYIALSGTLSMIGREGERPVPPLNLVGDFGGGGMLLAFGVVCGLIEASRSGRGQVIDAAMVDGAALLAAMIHGFRGSGAWGARGTNLLDTGAFFYEVYETADGRYVSFGSIEPQFYAQMLELTGLATTQPHPLPDQHDPAACGPRPATSGAASSKGPTSASLPCWSQTRPQHILTTPLARPSWSWAGLPSRHRHRASPGQRRACLALRPARGTTPTRLSPNGVSNPVRLARSGAPGRCAEIVSSG
jgi:crotonobetainyl-CoA:carnitine CoA-transferase CaiB-like acyl-CoA transferase